jgi:hypothetical protein
VICAGLGAADMNIADKWNSQPPQRDQIVFSNRLDLNRKSLDSGERQDESGT